MQKAADVQETEDTMPLESTSVGADQVVPLKVSAWPE